MEEIKVDFDMYLEAYETVEEKRRTFDLKVLDIEIAELQEKVANDEKNIQTFTQERIDELNQINHANLSFEQYAEYFMKDIRICDDKIAQLKEERSKREKDQDQFEKLQGNKNTIRANAKKEKEQKVNLLESKLQNEMLNEELRQLQEKYNEILLLEEQDPKRVKDEKYKTYLQNKIQSKQKEIKDYQEPIKKQIKGINDDYLKFLKNLGKVDRGKKIDDLDYILKRLDHQDAQIKKDQAAKQQEEQKRKLEEQKRKLDELNKNRVQDPDEAWKLAIREEERRKFASEADKKYKDAQIIMGRKGKIVFDGVTYKIPKRAIKEGYNFNVHDIEDIFSNYEDIEQGKLVTSIIRQGLVDPAVINLIDKSSMNEFDKEEFLKRYIDDAKNIYNATSKDEANDIIKNRPFLLKYDLEDISKTNIISRIAGNEINEEEKFEINQIAYDANRYGICEIIGEGYKPNWVSRLTAFVTRKDIKRLPTLGEQQVVAEKYNELRKKGETNEITRMGFREQLKVPPEVQTENGKKAKNLNNVQIAELIDLHESQTAQEKDDEER